MPYEEEICVLIEENVIINTVLYLGDTSRIRQVIEIIVSYEDLKIPVTGKICYNIVIKESEKEMKYSFERFRDII